MTNKCENCAEKCPQAEMAHQAALGRMYATKEFTAMLKKVESGELVEVVRCKDCRFWHKDTVSCDFVTADTNWYEDDYCSYGERRNGK